MRNLTTYFKDAATKVDAAANGEATLLANTTYYVELCDLDGDRAGLTSIEWKHDALIVVTITIEGSNFPELTPFAPSADGFKAVAGIAVVTILGGAAGIEIGSWANQGYGRLRAKLEVGATGGVIRGAVNHKAG